MKQHNMFLILLLFGTVCFAQKSEKSEVIRKELKFEKEVPENVFYLANINGSIDVEAYDGRTIVLEAKKKIIGKTQDRINQGMQEIGVGVIDRLDTIIVYMTGPCGKFSNSSKRWNNNGEWCYNWNDCNRSYDFNMDFVVKVPRSMNLYLSTVNNGDISVAGVLGSQRVQNINGSISIDGIEGKINAHTINGDVTLNYNKNPDQDSKYYTLNGDINANFKQGLSADMKFKSFNGEFYTNLQDLDYLPSVLETSSTKNGKGISYKLDGKRRMRTGSGGVLLDFETFNGDVYLKEIN